MVGRPAPRPAPLRRLTGPATALALLAAAVGGCGVWQGEEIAATGLPGEPNARVVRVVDGDTVVVETGGVEESVRLIGIDTPETVKPGSEVECFGPEASERTADLLPEGTSVVLERDVEARDRYDRLLAYVHRADDATFVNLALVEEGYAQPAPYPPNVAHEDAIDAAGRRARKEGLGMWGACGGDDLFG